MFKECIEIKKGSNDENITALKKYLKCPAMIYFLDFAFSVKFYAQILVFFVEVVSDTHCFKT